MPESNLRMRDCARGSSADRQIVSRKSFLTFEEEIEADILVLPPKVDELTDEEDINKNELSVSEISDVARTTELEVSSAEEDKVLLARSFTDFLSSIEKVINLQKLADNPNELYDLLDEIESNFNNAEAEEWENNVLESETESVFDNISCNEELSTNAESSYSSEDDLPLSTFQTLFWKKEAFVSKKDPNDTNTNQNTILTPWEYFRRYLNDDVFEMGAEFTARYYLQQTGKPAERIKQFFGLHAIRIPVLGRCSVRQYVKNKPRPAGLKNFILSISSGTVLYFEIYQGATTPMANRDLGLGPAIILRLRKTLSEGSYFDKSMSRGDSDEFVRSDRKICISKWMDNESVLMISTAFGVQPDVTVRRWDKKRQERVDVKSIVNSWMEYKTDVHGKDTKAKSIDFLDFRLNLGEYLIFGTKKRILQDLTEDEEDVENQLVKKKKFQASMLCADKRYDGFDHWPTNDGLKNFVRCRANGCESRSRVPYMAIINISHIIYNKPHPDGKVSIKEFSSIVSQTGARKTYIERKAS
ncbi:hypothetical protein ILUMI_23135 [Ignelater luminosus]|uniref:PiggyBac transposable element-derived protein domain-containing protein n=1 Tax=Ignelater luminosus TaxID=2038154 RepID=A0A8K0C9E1_IGNLU|nr:hypothetical protein ILUMI_23135 [Ignelater luminosus]